jgi:hypothetical protein
MLSKVLVKKSLFSIYYFSGATQIRLHLHGQTEMEHLVMIGRNARAQINVKTANVAASVLNAIHCVNTAMEMVVV